MKDIRLESIADPFAGSAVAATGAARVIAFAATTGLLQGMDVKALDLPTWRKVVERLQGLGIGRGQVQKSPPKLEGRNLSHAVEVIYDAIEASPMPESEWKSMRELLKDDLLERLLGVSRQSIQRYASRERETPQQVADRLHAVALIVSDLAGSYNEFGIRRWFERVRAQLGGKSPAQLLKGEWDPDAEMPRRVRELAAALSGT